MEYKCGLCGYSTSEKYNYKRHQKSKKHNENINSAHKILYKCTDCNSLFIDSNALARHTKQCIEKSKGDINVSTNLTIEHDSDITCAEQIQALETRIKELEIENNHIQQLYEKEKEITKVLKEENSHLKFIVNNAGTMIKTSVSTMAYIIKNYNNAPLLKSLPDYSILHCEQSNNDFIEELITEYDNHRLHAYIGNFLIKIYKHEDPAKQSIWNSDTSRLTYVIRELIENNKVDWTVDKKGIRTNKYIIKPLLDYIEPLIRTYIGECKIGRKLSPIDSQIKVYRLKVAVEMIKAIEDSVLCNEILKYISPHFYMGNANKQIVCQ